MDTRVASTKTTTNEHPVSKGTDYRPSKKNKKCFCECLKTPHSSYHQCMYNAYNLYKMLGSEILYKYREEFSDKFFEIIQEFINYDNLE